MANRNDEALRARAGEMIQRLGEFALIQQRRRHLQNAELARECAELIALLTPRPEPAGRVEWLQAFHDASMGYHGCLSSTYLYLKGRADTAAHAPQEGAE